MIKQMSKSNIILVVGFVIVLVGCNDTVRVKSINSPIAIVVKLNAAESLLDLEEAQKYQDVNRIYSKHIVGDTSNPEDFWKQVVESSYSLSNSKKFTSQWKYFDYDILESINGRKAEVTLRAKNIASNVQQVVYQLELYESGWKVVSIEYKRK